jgi:RNA-binding protein
MKRVGTVVRATNSLAVVRTNDDTTPDLGTAVIDEELDDVGTIVDVFGPVEQPYLTITPETEHTATLVGTVVYAR